MAYRFFQLSQASTRFRKGTVRFLLAVVALSGASSAQETPHSDRWTLDSGGNLLEIRKDDQGIWMTLPGPGGSELPALGRMPLVSMDVAGAPVRMEDLELLGAKPGRSPEGASTLSFDLRHSKTKLGIGVSCMAAGDTGVFVFQTTLRNPGEEIIEVQRCPSLCLEWGASPATLSYLQLNNRAEFNLSRQPLSAEAFRLHVDSGRSTRPYAQWWMLHLEEHGVSWTAELAYSGNWSATFTNPPGKAGRAEYGMSFDNGGPLRLGGKSEFRLPKASLAVTAGSDLSDSVIAHHRYLRRFVMPKQKANDPLLVCYNTWYAHRGDIDEKKVLKAIPYAKQVGCEAFVIDANWHYCPGSDAGEWSARLGDWVIDPERFPRGLRPIIQEVRRQGMKFGIWFEPEVASLGSKVRQEHPDWFLTNGGKPIATKNRVHFDYAKPEVREWMLGKIANVMREGKLDWVKLDYNVDIGASFDPAGDVPSNTRLHDHLEGFNLFLQELRTRYPDLVVESCASGGLRMDPGILSQTHTGWISDTVNPRYSVQLAWGALIPLPPEYCNHWMVGDLRPNQRDGLSELTSTDPKWWDFMFRVPMNGQYGYSCRFDEWPKKALDRAAENTALYKRIRGVIHGGDVYHLTPAPASGYHPEGWMGIQYASPEKGRSVLMTYRLGKSGEKETFRLRGLEANAEYKIARDGKLAGAMRGKALMEMGLEVELEDEWNSQIVEIQKAH